MYIYIRNYFIYINKNHDTILEIMKYAAYIILSKKLEVKE